MSEREKQTARTYTLIAPHYAKRVSDPETWRSEFDIFTQCVPTGTVLDLGCGHGRHAPLFAEAGISYVGADLCTRLLELSPAMNRVQMDMKSLAFGDNSFDGIWACGSLLHIPKSSIDSVIAEMGRVLKPDGTVFASIKETRGGSDEQMLQGAFREPRLFVFYQADEFPKRLASNGFDVVGAGVNPMDYKPPQDFTIWLTYFAKKK